MLRLVGRLSGGRKKTQSVTVTLIPIEVSSLLDHQRFFAARIGPICNLAMITETPPAIPAFEQGGKLILSTSARLTTSTEIWRCFSPAAPALFSDRHRQRPPSARSLNRNDGTPQSPLISGTGRHERAKFFRISWARASSRSGRPGGQLGTLDSGSECSRPVIRL